MSKQLNIATALVEKETVRQKECRHAFGSALPSFDYESDRVYYFAICKKCGYRTD